MSVYCWFSSVTLVFWIVIAVFYHCVHFTFGLFIIPIWHTKCIIVRTAVDIDQWRLELSHVRRYRCVWRCRVIRRNRLPLLRRSLYLRKLYPSLAGGFSRRDSLTNILFNLGLPSFDTLMTTAAVSYARLWTSCTNHIVMYLRQLV